MVVKKKRPEQWDILGMVKGLVRLLYTSPIRYEPEFNQGIQHDDIARIGEMTAGSVEMEKKIVELWIKSVNAIFNKVDASVLNASGGMIRVDSIDDISSSIACRFSGSLIFFENNRDISVNDAAARLKVSHQMGNHEDIMESLFIMMHAGKVKIGALKFGTNLLVKSKSETFSR